MLVSLGLSGGAVALALSFRWGLLLMLDPEALPQWQRWLKSDAALPTTTLAEFRQALAERGQTLGEPVVLTNSTTNQGGTLLLVPTLNNADGHLVALTLFQRLPMRLAWGDGEGDRLTQLATVALPPFNRDLTLGSLASTSPHRNLAPAEFRTTQLTRLPPPPVDSDLTWFTVEGHWSASGLELRYGQLLAIDAAQPGLHLLAAWSSPANRLPQWADLDGVGHTDLVVDQRLGLEPSLQGFQVLEAGGLGAPVRLQPVSWVQVPLAAGNQAMDYQTALRLARSGLWQQADDRLTALKTDLVDRWNPAAEAQRQLIIRYAAIARQQAEQDWALPTQQILALLIDGQWAQALTELEANPTLITALLRRLEVDQGQLWNRITATTSLPEPEPAVYVWGGLMLTAQQNPQAAQEWLARQPVAAKERQRLATILAAPTAVAEGPSPEAISATTTTASKPTATSPRPVRLAPVEAVIGTVEPLAELEPGRWYVPPGQATDASLGQWYRVEVASVKQAQGWVSYLQTSTPAANAAAVWSALAAQGQPGLTLLRWTAPREAVATSLSVRGVAVTQGRLTLLATGPAVGASVQPLLAFSKDALVWLDTAQQQAIDPVNAAASLTQLVLPNQAPPSQALVDSLGTLQHHTLDLTGNGQPERVFTLDSAALSQLQALGAEINGFSPKTIILGQSDRILYTDLIKSQALVALTNPSQGLPQSLLVYRHGGYMLLPWSEANQQFGADD